MRVLHFAGNYFPVPGGTTTRIHNMLAAPDNEHLLVVPWPASSQCPAGLDAVPARETRGHIHIRRVALAQANGRARHVSFWDNRRLARELVRCVRDETVDLLHGHNPWACAMASLDVKRRTGLPMVYEVHGIMHDLFNLPRPFGPLKPLNDMGGWLMRRALAYYERRVVYAAERLIVQTDAARRRLIKLYDLADKPIDVIRNGVDAEKFDPARWHAQRDPLRRRHGWNDRRVCLYAGYLDTVNGIAFLLQALPRLSGAVRRRLRIVLLGRGPLQREVAQAAQRHADVLEYHGPVGHDEMPAYYAACDAFVIPRPPYPPAETLLPVKLLEAMAMGKVVLVSDVAALAEVVADGSNGLVFRKGDSAALLHKLAAVARSDDRLAALGCRARQSILEHYTWDASRTKLQWVYGQLV